jgi:hypothetical protein
MGGVSCKLDSTFYNIDNLTVGTLGLRDTVT